MSRKVFIVLVLITLMTIAILQNHGETDFNLIITSVRLPKMIVMTAMSVGGLLIGILLTSGSAKTKIDGYSTADDLKPGNTKSRTLSDEDRDYISEP